MTQDQMVDVGDLADNPIHLWVLEINVAKNGDPAGSIRDAGQGPGAKSGESEDDFSSSLDFVGLGSRIEARSESLQLTCRPVSFSIDHGRRTTSAKLGFLEPGHMVWNAPKVLVL